jgi:hypothetical protein
MNIAAASVTEKPDAKSWRDVLPVHLDAKLFPPMSEGELQELGEDIRKYGLQSPIVVYCDYDVSNRNNEITACQLLSGANRLDAMALAGVRFKLHVDDGGVSLEIDAPPSWMSW